MEILEQMLPDPVPSNTPTKKSKTNMTKTGAKRALTLSYRIVVAPTIINFDFFSQGYSLI